MGEAIHKTGAFRRILRRETFSFRGREYLRPDYEPCHWVSTCRPLVARFKPLLSPITARFRLNYSLFGAIIYEIKTLILWARIFGYAVETRILFHSPMKEIYFGENPTHKQIE